MIYVLFIVAAFVITAAIGSLVRRGLHKDADNNFPEVTLLPRSKSYWDRHTVITHHAGLVAQEMPRTNRKAP